MDYQVLKLTKENRVLTVTINRPEALNALNSRFFSEMDAVVESLKKNTSTRVLIITGEGKAFAAGADIAEMVDMDSEQGKNFSKTGQNTFANLENLHIPVIAAVNGFSLGGGCELALACDFRIASSKAKFGQPEVNLGLIPGYAATQRLPRLIGSGNALYLLLSAEMVNADEALRMGLVQKVVEPEVLIEECRRFASVIISKGPKAVQLVKQAVRQGLQTGFSAGSNLESELFGSLFGNEGAEGMRAFLDKRKPDWS